MDVECEHQHPEEFDVLSPVEDGLIALHTPFGYIAKFTVDNKTPSGRSYRKPTLLPYPLLETMENIHVSWSGPSKPSAADVGNLFPVRKSRVKAALSWLQINNQLY
jgi:hypothetical protein